MGKAEFLSAMERAIARMREASSEVTIVHHNDADGLSSAAVLQVALSRANFAVQRIPLERVHPPILERIHDQSPGTIIYVDLGGKAAPVISQANRGRRFTIILDHHHPEESTDPEVVNLTTEFFGLSGEMDIAATTAVYLFARALDDRNRDLAYLGVIAAVGDYHDRGGRLVGENRQVLLDAMAQGQVLVEEANGREQYVLTRFGDPLPMFPFAMALTTLGAPGYYSGGPDLGFRMCLEGPFQRAAQKLAELDQIKQAAYDKVLAQLKQEGFRVPEAAKQVGGSIDASHDYSAATVISIGREAELIAAMDELVSGAL
jgi:hypothetical protein